MNTQIEINTRLELKAYTRALYYLTYKKWSIIFITTIGLLLMFTSILIIIGIYKEGKGNPYPQLMIGFIMAAALPVTIYFQARKNYNGNTRLGEETTYIFNQDTLQVKGESFNSTLSWAKMHKVVELNSWILIYESAMIAMFLPKDSFTSEQLHDFKALVKSIDGLNVKLK